MKSTKYLKNNLNIDLQIWWFDGKPKKKKITERKTLNAKAIKFGQLNEKILSKSVKKYGISYGQLENLYLESYVSLKNVIPVTLPLYPTETFTKGNKEFTIAGQGTQDKKKGLGRIVCPYVI